MTEAKFKVGQIVETTDEYRFRGVISEVHPRKVTYADGHLYSIKIEGKASNIVRCADEIVSGIIPRDAEPPDSLQWPSLKIDPASIPWREVGEGDDPRQMLRAAVQIGTCWLNLEAWAAYFEMPDGHRVAVNSVEHGVTDVSEALFEVTDNEGSGLASRIWRTFGMEGAAEVIEIEGRWYCLFAYPYSG